MSHDSVSIPGQGCAVVAARAREPSLRTAVVGSLVGTLFEWYDFFLYGAAAALVFKRLFFPTLEPLAGTLASLATFAVGFIARPFGGIMLGHIGDRIGRTRTLVVTLLMMGLSTVLLGLLPTYEQAGIWAPIALVALRIVQGFAAGGEWGGAVLVVVERAPTGRRGFLGSLSQLGVPLGLCLATVAFAAAARLPDAQFLAWGWRLPFLASMALLAVGVVIRHRVPEAPSFRDVAEQEEKQTPPAIELLRGYRRPLAQAIGVRLAENGAFYVFSTFAIVYATQQLHLPRDLVLNETALAVSFDIVSIPFFGWLSDVIGARRVYLFGAISTALSSLPFFWLVNTVDSFYILLALLLCLAVGHAAMYAPQAALMAEMFPIRIRYSGISIASQAASVLSGALAPFIAALLLQSFGYVSVALYVVALSLVTIYALITLRTSSWSPG